MKPLEERNHAFGPGRFLYGSDTHLCTGALGSPNYFNHDAGCAGNIHNAALSIYGIGPGGLIYDYKNTKHMVLYGRNIVESLMVKESKAFMAALARGMKCTYIDPRASITACKATTVLAGSP